MWKCCVQSGNSEQAITSNRILRSERSIARKLSKTWIYPSEDARPFLEGIRFERALPHSGIRRTALESGQARWRHQRGPHGVQRTTLDRARSFGIRGDPAVEFGRSETGGDRQWWHRAHKPANGLVRRKQARGRPCCGGSQGTGFFALCLPSSDGRRSASFLPCPPLGQADGPMNCASTWRNGGSGGF